MLVRPIPFREATMWTTRKPDPSDPRFQISVPFDEPDGRWFIRKHGKGSVVYLIPTGASMSAAKRAIRDAKEPKRLLAGDCFLIQDQPVPKGWYIFVRTADLANELRSHANVVQCGCMSYHINSVFRIEKDLLLKMKMGWGPFSDFSSIQYFVKEF